MKRLLIDIRISVVVIWAVLVIWAFVCAVYYKNLFAVMVLWSSMSLSMCGYVTVSNQIDRLEIKEGLK